MMKRSFLLLIAIIALTAAVINAQDAVAVAYGEVVVGEIAEDGAPVLYTFEGTEGDVILVEQFVASSDSDFYSPNVTVLTPDGGVVVSEGDNYEADDYAISRLSAVLPTSGTYTVEAGRDADATDFGTFTFRVSKLEVIDGDLTLSINTETYDQFVLLPSGDLNVTLTSIREDVTSYAPGFRIYQVNEEGVLRSIMTGSTGIEGTSITFSLSVPNEGFILGVTNDIIGYMFDDIDKEIGVSISQ